MNNQIYENQLAGFKIGPAATGGQVIYTPVCKYACVCVTLPARVIHLPASTHVSCAAAIAYVLNAGYICVDVAVHVFVRCSLCICVDAACACDAGCVREMLAVCVVLAVRVCGVACACVSMLVASV